MNITPDEIRAHQFKNSFRGYDTLEVRDFLDFVAGELGRLLEEYDRLKNKVQKKDELLAQYQKEEEYLKKAMLSAQQIADEIKENAEKQAKQIVQEAHNEKEQLFANTQKDLKKIQDEMKHILKTKKSFITMLQKTLKEGEQLLNSWNQPEYVETDTNES